MNYFIEASSIACWWASYKTISTKDDVLLTCLGGFTSGLILSGICLPNPSVRLFPETIQERKTIFKSAYRPTVLRMGLGHACFFTVYEGMQKSVKTARSKLGVVQKRDWQDFVNDFWIGGISGWCFRAVSLSFPLNSPLAIPLTAKLMAQTFVTTGGVVAALETLDYIVKENFQIPTPSSTSTS